MRAAAITAGLLALATPILAQNITLPTYVDCGSKSSPNEIYGQYTNNVTGVLNGTIYILPIPLEKVRAWIPKKWNILTQNYMELFPNLPADTYPAIAQLQHDHDVRFGQVRISDFMRASIEFPFIDLIGDNSTSFRWVGKQFVSADKPVAIAGIAQYGTVPIPADFNPTCNAYNGSRAKKATFSATQPKLLGDAFLDAEIWNVNWTTANPMPLMGNLTQGGIINFLRDVTNQPVFGDGLLCDTQLYPKYHDEGIAYEKDFVSGEVMAKCAIANAGDEMMKWEAIGYRQPKQFIENNDQDCRALKGYNADVADRILLGIPNPFHKPGTPLV